MTHFPGKVGTSSSQRNIVFQFGTREICSDNAEGPMRRHSLSQQQIFLFDHLVRAREE
jgi:hypothetical protein